jgi:hypothetical protein
VAQKVEICIGDLSLLFYFYRRGLTGIWYCNLRNPVKATSARHSVRHTEARPQYKAFNIFFNVLIDRPEDWNGAGPSRKNKTLGSCLLANSRQPL